MSETCERCGRIVLDSEDVTPVCSGCLTAQEDADETGALVWLLRLSLVTGPQPLDTANPLRGAIDSAIDNLRRRLGPFDLAWLLANGSRIREQPPLSGLTPNEESR